MKRVFEIYKNSYAGLPKASWMLAFVILVNRSGSMVLFFMTLYLTKSLDFSIAQAGKMISIYGMGSILGAYLGGLLTDKLGSKTVQLLSLVLSGIGFIILGYVNTTLEIAVMLFLVAIVNEGFRPANAVAVSNVSSPELRPRAFGLNRLAINLGVTIGPALGGFLARWDYIYLFWTDALTCIFAAALMWRFFRGQEFETHSAVRETEITFRPPWKDGIYIFFLLLILGCSLMFTQLFNTWPLYLRDIYGLLEDKIGLLLAINAFMIVLIEMPLIHRIEAIHPLRVIALGALFLYGGFTILPWGKGMAYGAFTVIIWTIGEMLIFPMTISFVANRAPDQNRGKYLGMYTMSYSLGFVIGPASGAWIYETWGATQLWICAGCLGILVVVGFLAMEQILKREAAQPQAVLKQ